MAKNKAFYFSFLLTLLWFSAAGAGHLRDQVAATYSGQVGVREATGRNDGPQVKMYLASVNLKQGYAWCGAFVNWVYRQHNIKGPAGAAMANAWFTKARTVWRRGDPEAFHAEKADVFGIYYPGLKRIGHVGFVEKWDHGSDVVITVEGNTNGAGSREGNGVYRKRRLKSQIYAVADWIT